MGSLFTRDKVSMTNLRIKMEDLGSKCTTFGDNENLTISPTSTIVIHACTMSTQDLVSRVCHHWTRLTPGTPGHPWGIHGLYCTATSGLGGQHWWWVATLTTAILQKTKVPLCICCKNSVFYTLYGNAYYNVQQTQAKCPRAWTKCLLRWVLSTLAKSGTG